MRSTVLRVLYFALLLAVAVTSIYIYTIWWDEYQRSHPKVTVAEYQTYREDIPFHGILLWKDYVLTSAWEGTVSYPLGEAARVAKGDVVAVVMSRAGKMAVRAPEPGYFVAGFDGAEENWTYVRFWTGDDLLPTPPEFVAIRPGTHIPKGGIIGKMVPQPQELRCIAFVDLPPMLLKALDQRVVRVRLRETQWPVKADVRVFLKLHERRGKVYLTLPFFPIDIVQSRVVSYRIVAGGHSGAAVPESCVVARNGRVGVFVVEGTVSKFVEVKGIPMPEHLFLITEGVVPGMVVILNAEKAREGNVRLW
jgi:hypothetical protein